MSVLQKTVLLGLSAIYGVTVGRIALAPAIGWGEIGLLAIVTVASIVGVVVGMHVNAKAEDELREKLSDRVVFALDRLNKAVATEGESTRREIVAKSLPFSGEEVRKAFLAIERQLAEAKPGETAEKVKVIHEQMQAIALGMGLRQG